MTDHLSHAYKSRPRELILRLQLPKLDSAADIDLDINEKHLEFDSGNELYHLEMDLPFAVDPDAEGSSAKFDKSRHLLVVTLPVNPPTQEELSKFVAEETARRDQLEEMNAIEEVSASPVVSEIKEEVGEGEEEGSGEVVEGDEESVSAQDEGTTEEEEAIPSPTILAARAHELMIQEEEKRREAAGGRVVGIPEWQFEDERGVARMSMTYHGVKKEDVAAHFTKGGFYIDFSTKGRRYNLFAKTEAPVVPGWCKVKVDYGVVKVELSKAKPEPWGRIGELCSAEEAGLEEEAEAEEEKLRAKGGEVKEDVVDVVEKKSAPGEEARKNEVKNEVPSEFRHKLGFIAAPSYEGTKEGYVFQSGPDGIGYYQDVGPMCKCAGVVPEPEEPEEPANSKWDWVQEARQGGPSTSLKDKTSKPAFQRGFIAEAANAKKAAKAAEEEEFVAPGLDDDSDCDSSEEEEGTQGRVLEGAWAPTSSLQTQRLVLELD